MNRGVLPALNVNLCFQPWGLVLLVVSIQTPDPAVRPISHFHSCSSPCGLQLKIAKRGKGGLNFIRWWQIYSSITGERRTLCARMTVLHTSNARNRAEPVSTEKKGDGGRYSKALTEFIKENCSPQA